MTLLAEGSEVEEYALPISEDGILRIAPRLRERHLTEHVDTADVQASGYHVRVWIWSDRDNICIGVPLDGYRVERHYKRSIHRWGVNLSRFLEEGNREDNVGSWNDAKIERSYGSDSNKEMVQVKVVTHDREGPSYV